MRRGGPRSRCSSTRRFDHGGAGGVRGRGCGVTTTLAQRPYRMRLEPGRHSSAGQPGVQRLLGGRGRPGGTLSALLAWENQAIVAGIAGPLMPFTAEIQHGWGGGRALPLESARLRVGDRTWSQPIDEEQHAVVFDVDLVAGRHRYEHLSRRRRARSWRLLRLCPAAYQTASPTVCLTWRQTPGQSPRLQAVRMPVQPGLNGGTGPGRCPGP